MERLPIVLIMGASSTGKTTIAKQVESYLELSYLEADDFHSKHNIDKMKRGEALNDEDRKCWLKTISDHLQNRSEATVLACSSLKRKYRDTLRNDYGHDVFKLVFLKASEEELKRRLKERHENSDHFMPPGMIESQLQDLEEPHEDEEPIVVDVERPLDVVVQDTIAQLKKWGVEVKNYG